MNKLLIGLIGCIAAFTAHAQDWGGSYAGVSLGRFSAKSTWTTTQLGDPAFCAPSCFSSPDADLDANGFYGAGHAGYNWTLGRFAFIGLEAGFGYANASATIDHVPGWNEQMQDDRISAKYQWNASIVGRLGLTAGPVALYGLVGPSWQKVTLRVDCPSSPASWCSDPQSESRSEVRTGWTAGAGAEFRLPARWRARLDYRYAKYQDKEYTFFGGSPSDTIYAKVSLKTSIVTLGLSYSF